MKVGRSHKDTHYTQMPLYPESDPILFSTPLITYLNQFHRKSLLLAYIVTIWIFLLSYSLFHPSTHSFSRWTSPSYFPLHCCRCSRSFAIYSRNETGSDLFLLSSIISVLANLLFPSAFSCPTFPFLPHKQTHPNTHSQGPFISVCGLHPCFVTFVALWFLFNFSASLYFIIRTPYFLSSPPSILLSLSLSLTLSFLSSLLSFSGSHSTSIPLH